MISAEVIDELILAHKLNLVSTIKMQYASRILEERKLVQEAKRLQNSTRIEIVKRTQNINNTFSNSQNVHLTSVQDSMMKSIQYVINYKPKNIITNQRTEFLKLLEKDLKSFLKLSRKEFNSSIDQIMSNCYNENIHSIYKVTYYDVLYQVYSIINDLPDKPTLLLILYNELLDGHNTCFTGQITRMVNALNGFVDGVNVSISKTEELSNSIVAIRKKYGLIYKNPDDYISETVPVVWQLLEDMCIPEHEHDVWLEYI
jgi:hypothetical protein